MDQSELLVQIISCFESLNVPYFITGSIASIAYGEPRFTHDIDIVTDLEMGQIILLKKCFPEDSFYLDEDSAEKAIRMRSQFNIIHPASGLKVDVIICKKTDFDTGRFKRTKRIQISEKSSAQFASPEDVIIMKMVYYKKGKSEKHLRDIASMLKISPELIDKKYISNWADKLNLMDIWNLIISKT